MNAESGETHAVFWQLAFWPPDREVIVTSKRQFAPKIMARIATLELAVIIMDCKAATLPADGYPCTYPGCARGPHHPFEASGQLGNHRLAAHGIRSTNEESIRRQERRDKQRARRLGAAPEYIDPVLIREAVGAAVPPPAGLRVVPGPLTPGDREHVRKRLAHFVGIALPGEVRRSPAEICLAVAEIAASALAPAYVKVTENTRADMQYERLESLFTKSAIAV
ncbi:MAG TPA: hypothetical protein VHR97_02705 [Candidatus Baltobacteraceae bacterium]|nr:hypothetical protein [Candidatus Baltobacteraceae bacterium]